MKKIFTFLVALVSACTFSAYAGVAEGTCGDNLTWTVNTKDSTLVISGEGKMWNYSDHWSNQPWYEYRSYIKYVTIEDGVTSIGNYTFHYCDSLLSINIGNDVTSIGNNAFYYLNNLTSITLPKNLTTIGKEAFYSCKGLISITIPENVTSIEDKAFAQCSNLNSVTIGNSVITIGNQAFYNCNSLISIILGNSVITIGDQAFAECSGLTSVIFGNSLTTIGKEAFYDCDALSSVIIPNSVTSIGERAFAWCSGLTSIEIPNSVTSIEAGTFQLCRSLTSIIIPNSVTNIVGSAFNCCDKLISVTIGNSVTNIGGSAFNYCNKIQEVTSFAPTPPSAASCGMDPTSVILYVPAEYVGAYSNAIWWEDFKEIRAINADYVVTFIDWDGTVLGSAGVTAGGAATAPADPTRAGYTFIGWDKDFNCVIGDMTVTAQYQINQYQVRFLDWNNDVLAIDSVDYQSAATAPADPTREGYTFIGWDTDFSSITTDMDVYAQYEAGEDKDLTLVFNDQDDNELSAQTVIIRVPHAPEIEGFTFLYWQPVAEPVEDVITLQAVYESNTPAAAPEVYVNPANNAQKLIRNGLVYILHEDKEYNVMGQIINE